MTTEGSAEVPSGERDIYESNGSCDHGMEWEIRRVGWGTVAHFSDKDEADRLLANLAERTRLEARLAEFKYQYQVEGGRS